jgi:hypothetical protein
LKPQLVIYSPAPATTLLHELNQDLGRAIGATVVATPLPDSVNAIGRLPEAEKRHRLPIVTTVDFLPARDRTGPLWHAYDLANKDLKLVCALYDVAFGIMAFESGSLKGRKIGVPPRPSSVRVLTEALLRDGWGILEEVELVDLRPGEVAASRVHATSWNLLVQTPEGYVPLLSRLTGRWLDVSEESIAAINRANPFKLDGVRMKDVTLLSFKQGLAAWDCTEDSVVISLLQRLAEQGSLEGMLSWPALSADLLHPGAAQFFRARRAVLR